MYIRIIKNHIKEADVNCLETLNRGWTISSTDCIALSWDDGTETVFAIFQGPYTLEEMCRDCRDFYEVLTSGKIYHIDKRTLTLIPSE